MTNVGIAKCSNCGEEKECILFWASWFSSCKLCETCLSKALRMCNPNK